jgi:hypothetical protein
MHRHLPRRYVHLLPAPVQENAFTRSGRTLATVARHTRVSVGKTWRTSRACTPSRR